MEENRKTVFFGPFIGELGWELAYWHGWVRKMCQGKYKNYRKIAASYAGREPFYPDVDEFWQFPDFFSKLSISQRSYASDFWKGILPDAASPEKFNKNISYYADELLEYFKKRLPKDAIIYTPHKLNSYIFAGRKYFFGNVDLKGFEDVPKSIGIAFSHQDFKELMPTRDGKEIFQKIYTSPKRMIAVFPRQRPGRHPEKNWSKEKYDLLIKNLKFKYPEHEIGLFGAPGGAYYVGEKKEDCYDFINIDEKTRFSVQLAALKKADLAIGSQSGALTVALLAKCPVVEWGYKEGEAQINQQNFLKTKFIYWPELNPSVEKIENLISFTMQGREKEIVPSPREKWSFEEKKFSNYIEKAKKIVRECIIFWIKVWKRIF